MKAYTDIEQSKRLKKILPLESADMFYYKDAVTKEDNPRIMNFSQVPKNKSMYYFPCWSLAALLSILPKSARLEKGKVTELYRASLPVELEASDWYINPVDACVELIEKLHELKIL